MCSSDLPKRDFADKKSGVSANKALPDMSAANTNAFKNAESAKDMPKDKPPHAKTDEKTVPQAAPAPVAKSRPQPALDADSLFNRANANMKNKKYDLALEDCNKVLEADPYHLQAYLLRADLYVMKEDKDKAVKEC